MLSPKWKAYITALSARHKESHGKSGGKIVKPKGGKGCQGNRLLWTEWAHGTCELIALRPYAKPIAGFSHRKPQHKDEVVSMKSPSRGTLGWHLKAPGRGKIRFIQGYDLW